MEDRAHFGELSFLVSEEHPSPGVVAVAPCEFYVLTVRNMMKFRDEYSECFVKIKRLLYDRMERIIAFRELHGIDVTPPYFIVEESWKSL